MAKNSITDYDNIAANNTDIQSVDIDEGCAPSGINNAIRELMADLADVNDGTVPLASPDINGGTIDGVTIGGTTAGAGTFTTGTFSGNLIVDTNTLFVDSANNRVGIGTSSPSYAIDTLSSGAIVAQFKRDASGGGSGGIRFGNNDKQFTLYGDNSNGLTIYDGSTERMRIDSSGNVGIGTSLPACGLHIDNPDNGAITAILDTDNSSVKLVFRNTTETGNNIQIGADGSNLVALTGATERMRIDSSGNLLVGKTTTAFGTAGFRAIFNGQAQATASNNEPLGLNRLSTDGDIAQFYKNSTLVGSIGTFNGVSYYGGTAGGIMFNGTAINPTNGTSARTDNINDIGALSFRYDDIYATNGTIQTSDANEKQQIASLTDAEMTAAKAISKLFKTFKWNDKVEAKGDAARRHAGVIAQDVQQAMTDAGLDAGDYAFFISSTWWEAQIEVPAVEAVEAQDAVYDEDGNIVTEAVEAVEAVDAYTCTDTYDTAEEAPEGATERTRLGIRYPELLSFIGAATEQRLASIESRLDALESV
jgi:hypothetical protein